MVRFELEPAEADYLVRLLMQRPLAEALPLYTKLGQQAAAQQRVQPLTGDAQPSQAVPNGADGAGTPAPH